MNLELFSDAEPGDVAYTYEITGEMIDGEFGWVANLEYFDDRDTEIVLVRKKWQLLESEQITLADPFPPDEDDDYPQATTGDR